MREQEELEAESSPEERARLDGLDPWSHTGAPVVGVGEANLVDGGRTGFEDLEDLEAAIGRRLLGFGLDRAWRIPFQAIATLELTAEASLQFDDLWVPLEIALWPGGPIERLSARVPAFYRRSLGDSDPLVASGRATRMGPLSPVGRRDFRITIKGQQGLVGLHQLAALTFYR